MSDATPDWFRAAFGKLYLTVYAHRDETSAAREIEFVTRTLHLHAGTRVLDAGCGNGRHARRMVRAGARVTAMDLSADLVERAAAAGGGPDYVRGDVRALPFRSEAFGAAVSLFTSFGYFDAAGDRQHLGELRRVVRHGAGFLLDFLNSPRVRRTLVPASERVVDGNQVSETRRIEAERVVKDVVVRGPDGAERGRWSESVRLYDADELAALLERAGFSVSARFGDLAGGPWNADADRLVLRAEAV